MTKVKTPQPESYINFLNQFHDFKITMSLVKTHKKLCVKEKLRIDAIFVSKIQKARHAKKSFKLYPKSLLNVEINSATLIPNQV